MVVSSCLALLFYEFFYAGLSLVGPFIEQLGYEAPDGRPASGQE